MKYPKRNSLFQPDISKYASEILPLLFQYLLQVSQDAEKNSKGLTRSYYALEMFCENLGEYLTYSKVLNVATPNKFSVNILKLELTGSTIMLYL